MHMKNTYHIINPSGTDKDDLWSDPGPTDIT